MDYIPDQVTRSEVSESRGRREYMLHRLTSAFYNREEAAKMFSAVDNTPDQHLPFLRQMQQDRKELPPIVFEEKRLDIFQNAILRWDQGIPFAGATRRNWAVSSTTMGPNPRKSIAARWSMAIGIVKMVSPCQSCDFDVDLDGNWTDYVPNLDSGFIRGIEELSSSSICTEYHPASLLPGIFKRKAII
ncbi:hypothetical protein MMC29_001617 [Sticta canariensis]|nr:hypothetical protein [Sticta canariensis]